MAKWKRKGREGQETIRGDYTRLGRWEEDEGRGEMMRVRRKRERGEITKMRVSERLVGDEEGREGGGW